MRKEQVNDTRQSIPQTRAYFQKVALGIDTEPIIKNWFNDGL